MRRLHDARPPMPKARIVTAAAIMLGTLSSCQAPPPTIFATLENGAIVFHIRDHAMLVGKIFGWDDDGHPVDRLWLSRGERSIVSLDPAPSETRPCNRSRTFPVRLGEARCGFVWSGDGQRLVPGATYEIRLTSHEYLSKQFCHDRDCRFDQWWSGAALGLFQVRRGGGVVNIRPGKTTY